MLFVPDWSAEAGQGRPTSSTPRSASPSRPRRSAKKIASQRKEIDKTKFPEADKLLAQIEKTADDLAKAPPAQKDKAAGRD